MLRQVMQADQRHRRLMRSFCSHCFFVPRDVIDEVPTFSCLAGATCTLHADRTETIDADTGPAQLIIYIDAAFDEFVVGLRHTGPHEAGGSGRPKKQNSGETHRVLKSGSASF